MTPLKEKGLSQKPPTAGEWNTHKENKSTKTNWDTARHDCCPVAAWVSRPCVPAVAKKEKVSLTLKKKGEKKIPNEPE
jgi:hypothetical protein